MTHRTMAVAAACLVIAAGCGDAHNLPTALDRSSRAAGPDAYVPLLSAASGASAGAALDLSFGAPAARDAAVIAGDAPSPGLPFDQAASARASLEAINAWLASTNAPVALDRIEWVTPTGAHEVGQTVFAHDRTLRLPSRWVPGDPRRGATGPDLTQLVFQPFAIANGAINGEPAIDAAFATWNDVHCSKLNVLKAPDTGAWPSIILTLGGVPGNPFLADISTIGFLPGFIFDLVLGPGASSNVLGVTFPFIWVNPLTGEPTDIDNDNRNDTALMEIWYNDNFLWKTGAGPGTDIQTVALHENGHALELGHFGRIAINNRTGALQVSPRAVMNAFILGTLREPLATDQAAFCSNFASWPR